MVGSPIFNFGSILSGEQLLRHEFELKNSSDRSIAISDAFAFTPCCSRIGPLPRSIPAGGVVRVPITMKTGRQSGFKLVKFAINMDSESQPTVLVAASAKLTPDWEFEPAGTHGTSIPVGDSGRLNFRILCRRKANSSEGRLIPLTVSSRDPYSSAFSGPVEDREAPEGLIESTRGVWLSVPTREIGTCSTELSFGFADGTSHQQAVRWEVTPVIRASPSGLALRPELEPKETEVILSSIDGTFRVLGVTSPLIDGLFTPTSKIESVHVLRLPLDASRAGTSVVEVRSRRTTRQPSVSLSVLILPPSKGPK